MFEPDNAPPKKFALKPREFEQVNAPPGTDKPSPDHDVFALLQEVRKHEAAAGIGEVAPMPPRKSHRKRDYLVLLLAGNLFMIVAFCTELFVGFQVQCLAARMPGELTNLIHYAFHEGLPMFFLPAMCMSAYSVALTWLMFGVMGKY